MVQARVTEQKANTIVDANTKRSNDLARDLEMEKKRRAEERQRLQADVAQAKDDHKVEVMAYRRALSTEEAKVVMLQKVAGGPLCRLSRRWWAPRWNRIERVLSYLKNFHSTLPGGHRKKLLRFILASWILSCAHSDIIVLWPCSCAHSEKNDR